LRAPDPDWPQRERSDDERRRDDRKPGRSRHACRHSGADRDPGRCRRQWRLGRLHGLEHFERFWRGIVDEVAAGHIQLFVARGEDGIVGTAQLHLITKPNQPHRAEIAKVLVHSAARRRGIGEALMRAAEAAALAAGRDLLVLDTDEAGAARRLYNRLGWTELGTIPRYALMPDGSDCGSTFFYKTLG
jgi:ribosomal protein S18 acetylase RimI-like enzyme